MSDVLIRGISPRIHSRIQKLAKAQNLSINQMMLKLIETAFERLEAKPEEERRREEAFRHMERFFTEFRHYKEEKPGK